MYLKQSRKLDVDERPKYIHYALVEGSGDFPVDMLRYDNCFPSDSDYLYTAFFESGKRIVEVRKYGWAKQPNWTDAGWKNFGWTIQYSKVNKMEIENVVDSTSAIVKETQLDYCYIVFIERTGISNSERIVVECFANVKTANDFAQKRNNTSKDYWYTVQRWHINKL